MGRVGSPQRRKARPSPWNVGIWYSSPAVPTLTVQTIEFKKVRFPFLQNRGPQPPLAVRIPNPLKPSPFFGIQWHLRGALGDIFHPGPYGTGRAPILFETIHSSGAPLSGIPILRQAPLLALFIPALLLPSALLEVFFQSFR